METIPNKPENQEIQEASQIQVLLARAQQGDHSILPELRTLLDNHPEIWKNVGDLAKHAEMSMLTLAGGNNLLMRESMTRRLNQFREDLAGPDPSMLEKLLVDRVAVSWLQVHHCDLEIASRLGMENTSQGVYAQRRLDSANRRYLFGLRQLATVRKLLYPGRSSGKAQKPMVGVKGGPEGEE